MRQLQLANIIIISILLGFSVILIKAIFPQLIERIISGNSDLYLPAISSSVILVVFAIFTVFYLLFAMRFYLKRIESNRFIFWACWSNIIMFIVVLLASAIIFYFSPRNMKVALLDVATRSLLWTLHIRHHDTYFFAILTDIITRFAVWILTILSAILFMIGKKKSLNKINVN